MPIYDKIQQELMLGRDEGGIISPKDKKDVISMNTDNFF